MSIMIDLPPTMAQEAQEYATVQGTTIERMLFNCLKAEVKCKGSTSYESRVLERRQRLDALQ